MSASDERMPSFYQDRGTARQRGDEERLPSFYDGQDWTEVRIRGKPRPTAATTGPVPKVRSVAQAVQMRKLEQAEGPIKVKRLSSESKQMIIARRVANGWNQQQLNQQCGFPLHTIRDIENGKLTPTPGQLNVLNRVLKAGLKYDI